MNALLAGDRELDDLDVLDEGDVDRRLLKLRARRPTSAPTRLPRQGSRKRKGTHGVGAEDGQDGLLGDDLGELDVAVLLHVVLVLAVVLVLVLLLELGVLHDDGRTSRALDLGAVLRAGEGGRSVRVGAVKVGRRGAEGGRTEMLVI